ncbi:MAG TPA: 50S ribosomal protein L29 [Candidatus Nanoarchaeia archaeon]|nr:50S ribosomal protein L29 [Candidatus Nanoarchaeia archaeon]
MPAKAKELRQLSDSELSSREKEAGKELMKLYSQVSMGTTLKKSMQIRNLRKAIARILTVRNEKSKNKEVTEKHE